MVSTRAIFDHGKTLTQVGQYWVRIYAGISMVVERGRLEKIVPESDATVDVVGIEARGRRHVLDAAVFRR